MRNQPKSEVIFYTGVDNRGVFVFHKLTAAQIKIQRFPAKSYIGADNHAVAVKDIGAFNQIIAIGIANSGVHGVIRL